MQNTQLDHSQHQCSGIKLPICYLAHDIDVPMNIGSLFRIADAMGVERIFLTGSSSTPPNSKIRKTSRSTEKYVDYSYYEDPFALIDELKRQGYLMVALEITTQSVDIRTVHFEKNQKICMIIGSENRGVSQELLDIADVTVHIPMLGKNSSMNVASACAVATFEIAKGFL